MLFSKSGIITELNAMQKSYSPFEFRWEVPMGSHFSPTMFWVYILQNPNGKFYIGHTDDIELRLQSHNRTDKVIGKYTRKNGLWILVWSEAHPSRAAAMAREIRIKSWKSARTIRIKLLGQSEQLSGRVPASRD